MAPAPLPLEAAPIAFGTDGWRGILGVDITVERLLPVAAAAAAELAYSAPEGLNSREVLIGYDRRFLAPELAEAICSAVRGVGLEPLLADSATPTPASSWAVVERQALGALVVTASHNPPEWLGLKIKGPFGGSVEGDFTQRVETRLAAGGITVPIPPAAGGEPRFDALGSYLAGLRAKLNTTALAEGLQRLGLRVIVDPMHGSAAGVLPALLGEPAVASGAIQEIRANRDPLFGGNPPEPLAPYLGELIAAVQASTAAGRPAMGIVFDGDGDRIAAIDERGRFCSTQLLMPLFIDHLARARQLGGTVVKTVSGSDLMQLVAEGLGRAVLEKPVGFKYIAAEMLAGEVLVGGEESGGVGFGMHLPERDAPFAALLLIEALVEGGVPLGERLDALQQAHGGAASYDRLDLRLPTMAARQRLEAFLAATPPAEVAGSPVQEVISTDGVKLRLGPSHWLMLRFSGTEPLLRLYCEAPSAERVASVLAWARAYALEIRPQPEGLEVEETGDTFAENARLKASAVAHASGCWALADDSGLSVDALGGAPGVHSARYAATDAARIERLLQELRTAGSRSAQFTAALALANPAGEVVLEVEGICPGTILEAPRGDGGFGYDPVFFVPEAGLTYAEMDKQLKGRIGHRGQAFAQLAPQLHGLLGAESATQHG